MSAHTPGPWLVSPNIHGGMTLVRTCSQSHLQIVPAEDAHLIAAAPELLEALQYAHDYLAANGWDNDPRLTRIVEALNKAEGR